MRLRLRQIVLHVYGTSIRKMGRPLKSTLGSDAMNPVAHTTNDPPPRSLNGNPATLTTSDGARNISGPNESMLYGCAATSVSCTNGNATKSAAAPSFGCSNQRGIPSTKSGSTFFMEIPGYPRPLLLITISFGVPHVFEITSSVSLFRPVTL
jgi:hypothetical protein